MTSLGIPKSNTLIIQEYGRWSLIGVTNIHACPSIQKKKKKKSDEKLPKCQNKLILMEALDDNVVVDILVDSMGIDVFLLKESKRSKTWQ
jgi:hypothetical protein